MKYRPTHRPLLCLVLLLMGAVACSPQRSPDEVVMRYLDARLSGDTVALTGLMCAPMESEVEVLANAFSGLGARLEGASCVITHSMTDRVTVQCRGAIVIAYDGEDTHFPLGTYQLVREDGLWRVCGESDSP